MRQFDHEDRSDRDESVSMIFEEQDHFQNVFAKDKEPCKPESSKIRKPPPKPREKTPYHARPCPRCSFLLLMEPTPKFGRISAKLISISFQRVCG
jgi:hypothetical protein